MEMDNHNCFNPSLPPGFRFYPTDQELIIHYLKEKVSSSSSASSSSNHSFSVIVDIDIYKFDPWELPGKAVFGEDEWFFFSPRNRKYPNGGRPNRSACSGYWKATGTDKPILNMNGTQCLGVKKALVFYKGRPPKGQKTNWLMLEYRLLDENQNIQRVKGSMLLDDWVLCRVRQKGKVSPTTKSQTYEDHTSNSSGPRAIVPSVDLSRSQNILKNCFDMTRSDDSRFHHLLVESQGSGEGNERGHYLNFQGGRSPEISEHEVNSNYDSRSAVTNPFEEALDSLGKMLSVGESQEIFPIPPMKKHCSYTKAPWDPRHQGANI